MNSQVENQFSPRRRSMSAVEPIMSSHLQQPLKYENEKDKNLAQTDKSVQTSLQKKNSWSQRLLNSLKRRTNRLEEQQLRDKKSSMSSMDLTILAEAHGMITDLLVDSSLPLNVSGTLRIVADMISPLLQQGLHRAAFSNPLLTVFEKTQVQEDEKQVMDQPDLKDDTPLSLKQRLQRNLGASSRRMSSSYTTTTSATGMPTFAMDYHANSPSSNRSQNKNHSNRSKSYAGIGVKSQERMRTLSHKSFSFSQTDSKLLRNSDFANSTEDDIFEVPRGNSVYFEEVDCKSEAREKFLQRDHNIQGSTNWCDSSSKISIPTKLKGICEPIEIISDNTINEEKVIENKDSADVLSQRDVENKPSVVLTVTGENNKNNHFSPIDPKRTEKEGKSVNKLDNSNVESRTCAAEYTQPPPLSQRNANPIVAQVTPVSIANHTPEKKMSDSLNVPPNGRRRSSCELHYEYEVAVSKDVDCMLSKLNEWDFPIFELSEKCNILTQLAFRIFQVSGFFTKFKIAETTFLKYFRALESGYHNIPYHNRIHAADVLHGVYYFTQHRIPGFNGSLSRHSSNGDVSDLSLDNLVVDKETYSYGCMSNVMPDLELMALYTAAAMHDFEHPGRTNAFLVATLNPKALLYNDRSVLESHHAAASWSLLVTHPGLNFLSGLDAADFKRFRFIVIEEILSTDLKKHFDFLAEWNEKNSDQGSGLNFALEADRLLVGQMAIKIADISGPSKEWSLHNRWTDRIIEEFYQQGEDERTLGMSLSAYMDRADPKVPELQASFIKHLVSPLYLAYEKAGILPGEWIDAADEEGEDEDGTTGPSHVGKDKSLLDGDSSDSEKSDDSTKKVIFNIVLDNIQKNHERWLDMIEEKSNDALNEENLAASTDGGCISNNKSTWQQLASNANSPKD